MQYFFLLLSTVFGFDEGKYFQRGATRFATAGVPQQGFHGQVCCSRLATTTFPGTGLLQQACHNNVSTGRFATAISKGRFAIAGLPQQGFKPSRVCCGRLATTRFPGAGLLQQACHNKLSRGRFATAGLPQQVCQTRRAKLEQKWQW